MRRAAIVGALVWALVVAGASVVTWTVIDAAGRDVVAATGAGAPGPATAASRPEATDTDRGTTPVGPRKATPRVRTWQGAAGSVVLRCRGSRAGLESTTPSDGWGVEVADRGPVEVEVEFRRSSPDARARVRGSCAEGVPTFEVDTRRQPSETGDNEDSSDVATETPAAPLAPSVAASSPGSGTPVSGGSGTSTPTEREDRSGRRHDGPAHEAGDR